MPSPHVAVGKLQWMLQSHSTCWVMPRACSHSSASSVDRGPSAKMNKSRGLASAMEPEHALCQLGQVEMQSPGPGDTSSQTCSSQHLGRQAFSHLNEEGALLVVDESNPDVWPLCFHPLDDGSLASRQPRPVVARALINNQY